MIAIPLGFRSGSLRSHIRRTGPFNPRRREAILVFPSVRYRPFLWAEDFKKSWSGISHAVYARNVDKSGHEVSGEKPLTAGARTILAAGVALVMLAFYLFCLVAVVLLVALIAGGLVLVLVALRFGAARLVAPYVEK